MKGQVEISNGWRVSAGMVALRWFGGRFAMGNGEEQCPLAVWCRDRSRSNM